MKNRRKRKRKSRTELHRLRSGKIIAIARITNLVPGGNPFGIGEWTLYMARGPERA